MYLSNINVHNVEKLYNLDIINKYKCKSYFSIPTVKQLNLSISINDLLSSKSTSLNKELNDIKIKFFFILFLAFNSFPIIKSKNEDIILNNNLKNRKKILLFLFYFFVENKKKFQTSLFNKRVGSTFYSSKISIYFFYDLFYFLTVFFSFSNIKEKMLNFSFLIKNEKKFKTNTYIQNLPFFRSNK
jgi:hypothetical protein